MKTFYWSWLLQWPYVIGESMFLGYFVVSQPTCFGSLCVAITNLYNWLAGSSLTIHLAIALLSGRLLWLHGRDIVEQIIAHVRRIVQIMIQATDLVQILYRGYPSRKNAGHAKFQYGRHFPMPPWAIPKSFFFALKRAADGWERLRW